MLLLVRHGDAVDKRSWKGPDSLRPLSPTGRLQAEGLVVRLEDYPVERILCSPTVRCQETVQPLARNRFLEIESLAALGVDYSPTQLLAVFWDRELRYSVLCTHGETIEWLLTRLVADGLTTNDPLEWPKGSTWLLERIGRRRVRGRLLAPLVLPQNPSLTHATRRVGPVENHLLQMVTDRSPAWTLVPRQPTREPERGVTDEPSGADAGATRGEAGNEGGAQRA
jgi:phosphohistidine phosphatase SixA